MASAQWTDPEVEVSREYTALRALPHLVSPVFYQPLGSTKTDTAASFKGGTLGGGIWGKYQFAAGHMADVRTRLEKHFHGSVFDVQRLFSDDLALLDQSADELAALAGDRDGLAAQLDVVLQKAGPLLGVFAHLGPGADPAPAKKDEKQHQVSVAWKEGHAHPLVRVALAIVRLQALGIVLTPGDPKSLFLGYCETVFKGEMNARRAEAEGGVF
jgi:hypothetical protein